MDKRVNDIVKNFAYEVKKSYKPISIYLFGSCAKGTQTTNSDIDIAVVMRNVEEDTYFDVYGKLWSIAASIDERVEPKLIIDNGEDDKYSFIYEIRKTGIMVE